MKIAILWTGLSGYLNACLKELASNKETELLVCHSAPAPNAPFDAAQFGWMRNRITWIGKPDAHELARQLENFGPDILVFSGWHVRAYRMLARRFKNRAWRVMTMDNCWKGTTKQMLAGIVGPLILPALAEVAWVPGERQAVYAQMLGFRQRNIIRGLYSCDKPALDACFEERMRTPESSRKAFIFMGRFIEEKGIDLLAQAYRVYRSRVDEPWPLYCYGSGQLRPLLENQEGIEIRGFIQPENLPIAFLGGSCFVLPSRFEPWGVVVHEAASAGLILLTSDKVGASVHLVQPGYNGYIFGNRDVEGLASLLSRVQQMSPARAAAMSRSSSELADQYSPKRWVQVLFEAFEAAKMLTG